MEYSPAERSARRFRQDYWNDGLTIPIPVDPFAIAAAVGVPVKVAPLEDDVDGFILKTVDDEHATIFVNSKHNIKRQRFTVAHELGHFSKRADAEEIAYIDRKGELSRSGFDPNERWANSFAAELLMPRAAVVKRWSRGQTASRLARHFNVSEMAMSYRLKNLGLA